MICAQSGHVNGHEGGAVEATGHKLFQVPAGPDGKVTAAAMEPVLEMCRDPHVAKPGLVYISDATETGGVYTLAELETLSQYCKANGMLLFLDGARLGAALTAEDNDVSLPDLARLCDAFYIGGTKNGALMGEALVIVNPALQPEFFRIKKQRGAVLAKGWLLGVQFQALLEDGLYWELAKQANAVAGQLQKGLMDKGYAMANVTTTNQIFPIVPESLLETLDKVCTYEVWCKTGWHGDSAFCCLLCQHRGGRGGSAGRSAQRPVVKKRELDSSRSLPMVQSHPCPCGPKGWPRRRCEWLFFRISRGSYP